MCVCARTLASVRARAWVCPRARACVRARVSVSARACVCPRARACVRARVRVSARACVCPRARACVRARVRVSARACVCPRARCVCTRARVACVRARVAFYFLNEMRFTEKFNPTAILELLIGFPCFVYIYICFYEYVATICSFPSYPIFTNTLWYKLTATITPPYFSVHDFLLR